LLGGVTALPLVLFGVAVLNGCIQAIDLPARLAYVPDLIPKEDLVNAVSLNSLVFNVARAVGPALAALLYLLAEWYSRHVSPESELTTLGSVWCFAANAVSFVAVLAALWAIRARESARPRKAGHSVLDGFRYVWHRKPLAGLLLATWLVSVFGWPTLTLFPPYTKLVLGHAEKEYSLLVSALGGGALLAGLTTATFGSQQMARRFVSVGMVLTALGILGLAVTVLVPSPPREAA
jgi:Na+/melibiose symporter-like transporter